MKPNKIETIKVMKLTESFLVDLSEFSETASAKLSFDPQQGRVCSVEIKDGDKRDVLYFSAVPIPSATEWHRPSDRDILAGKLWVDTNQKSTILDHDAVQALCAALQPLYEQGKIKMPERPASPNLLTVVQERVEARTGVRMETNAAPPKPKPEEVLDPFEE